mgnify:CR=1 FL=1
MEILILLIFVCVLLVGVAVAFFGWTVRQGTFDQADRLAILTLDYENRVTEEYRVNGNLYMIKVKPNAGPSYYLVDPEGSGDYEMRRDSPSTPLTAPQWALTRW